MKSSFCRLLKLLLAACLLGGSSTPDAAAQAPRKLLVVTVTVGFRHSSISVAEDVLAKLGKESGAFTVDYVRSTPRPTFKDDKEKEKVEQAKWMEALKKDLAESMSLEALDKYDGVIFANTSGDLPLPDKEGFLNWLKGGKAFIGMHSASDTFHGFPDFIALLGGEFRTHHAQVEVEALNQDLKHPATRHFGPLYKVFDEIYLLRNFARTNVHGLLWLDKHPNFGIPGDYPVAWCRTYEKSRVFYTSLGHREKVWDDPLYQQHILGGIKWALGLEQGDAHPQPMFYKLGDAEKKEGFMPLFNGVDLWGWQLRRGDGRPSWSVQNGMLVNTVTDTTKLVNGAPQRVHGTDLVTGEMFRDFTIRYEYMIPKGSNSGLYLRGRHEIQITDDFAGGTPQPGGNGAIYNLAAPARFASRKPGEWNQVEATMRGNRVTVILNGEKIHDNVEVTRPTGGELDGNVTAPGPIMLQGDHGDIAFRNLRLKMLR
ncbi:MAG: ThuA domain-containing protein [Verrucomicrobiota bacterium]